MAAIVSTTTRRVLSTYTTWLARAFVVACVLAAVLEGLFDSNIEPLGETLFVAGAVLVAAGLFTFGKLPAGLSMTLIAVGAVVGEAPMVYLLVPLLAAIVLIVLFARDAFRRTPA